MIKHFAADATVKQAWPDGLHASHFERDGIHIAEVQGSNFVLAHIEVGDGEQVGEEFIAPAIPLAPTPLTPGIQSIADELAAAGVAPFDGGTTLGVGNSVRAENVTSVSTLPPVQIAPDPVTEADAEHLREQGVHAVAEGSKLEVNLPPDPEPAPAPVEAAATPLDLTHATPIAETEPIAGSTTEHPAAPGTETA